jgi:hypothetical protein
MRNIRNMKILKITVWLDETRRSEDPAASITKTTSTWIHGPPKPWHLSTKTRSISQEVRLPLQLSCSWRSPRLIWHPKFPSWEASATGTYPQPNKLARTNRFKTHLCLGLPTSCVPFGFSYKNCTCHHPHPHPPLIPSCFDTTSKNFIMQFSPSFYLQIFSTMISSTFSLRSFICITDEVGPYLTHKTSAMTGYASASQCTCQAPLLTQAFVITTTPSFPHIKVR